MSSLVVLENIPGWEYSFSAIDGLYDAVAYPESVRSSEPVACRGPTRSRQSNFGKVQNNCPWQFEFTTDD
jgi:hypothetical protein